MIDQLFTDQTSGIKCEKISSDCVVESLYRRIIVLEAEFLECGDHHVDGVLLALGAGIAQAVSHCLDENVVVSWGKKIVHVIIMRGLVNLHC